MDFSDRQTRKLSAESNMKSQNKAQPGQTKQEFSTTKSTGSLDKLPAYLHSNGRIRGQEVEHQTHSNKTPINEVTHMTNNTRATTQLSTSTTVVTPPKVSSLKKTVAVNAKSDLTKSEACSTPEEQVNDVQDLVFITKQSEETAGSNHNTTADPSKELSFRELITVNTKPKLPISENSPALSTPEEIGKESGQLLSSNIERNESNSNTRVDTHYKVPILEKIAAVNSEISDDKNISKTQPKKEEYKEENSLKELYVSPLPERSVFSSKKLCEALPRRKQVPADITNRGLSMYDPNVIDNKWRSKQWNSSQHKTKPKVFRENEHCSSDSWIFLDGRIGSCVLSDDKPSVDANEGYLSDCNRGDDQKKLTDKEFTESKIEKNSKKMEKSESSRRQRNNIPFPGLAGQVVTVAIMVGFGILVLLTRQKK